MKIGALKRGTAELPPLDINTDRREVHERLIGPLTSTALIQAIDSFRAAEYDTPIGELKFDSLRTAKYERAYTSSAYVHRSDHYRSCFAQVHDGLSEIHILSDKADYLTQLQDTLFERFTALKYYNKVVDEGIEAHRNTVFNVAVPGYLIGRYGLQEAKEVSRTIDTIGPLGVSKLLREKQFNQSLARLALTANGLLRRSRHPYVDKPFRFPVLDVGNSVEVLNMTLPMPPPITVYELYEKGRTGNVGLSVKTRQALRYFLEYRNSVLDPHQNLGGAPGPSSRGCPVVQASVRVRRDDFTERQWTDLLEGDKPVATYDPDIQKLRLRRNAMLELSHLWADILAGYVPKTSSLPAEA